MKEEEYEITEKNFKHVINLIGSEPQDSLSKVLPMDKEWAIEKCFKLAQSYHKQELEKVLSEASKGFPNIFTTLEGLNFEEICKGQIHLLNSDREILKQFIFSTVGKYYSKIFTKASEITLALKEESQKVTDIAVKLSDTHLKIIEQQEKQLSEKDKLIADLKKALSITAPFVKDILEINKPPLT